MALWAFLFLVKKHRYAQTLFQVVTLEDLSKPKEGQMLLLNRRAGEVLKD
jgi:hypothetical protein